MQVDIKSLTSKFLIGDGCWDWIGGKTGCNYGAYYYAPGKQTPAHRYVYEWLVGPISKGLVLDHLCRNTVCVRPDHLEPVIQGENARRGIITGFCRAQLHPFDEKNSYIYPKTGQRMCRACRATRAREFRAKIKGVMTYLYQ